MEDDFYEERIRYCWNCHEYHDQIDECPCKVKEKPTSDNSSLAVPVESDLYQNADKSALR